MARHRDIAPMHPDELLVEIVMGQVSATGELIFVEGSPLSGRRPR
jgi:hypothetical protein